MEPAIISSPRLTAAPPMYSARAIRAFSMLFSAIAGGVMMAQNLKDLGQPQAASKALWGSIIYTIAVVWLLDYIPMGSTSGIFPIMAGYVGAMGLEAYAKQFMTSYNAFPAKSIKKPLLICLAIFIPLTAFFVYALVTAPDGLV